MNDLTTEIKKLEIETLDNLKLSKAKNTIRAYKSDYEDFALFCVKNRFESMPSNPKVISLYLTVCLYRSHHSSLTCLITSSSPCCNCVSKLAIPKPAMSG